MTDMIRGWRVTGARLARNAHIQAQQVIAKGAERWPTVVWFVRLYYLGFLYICISTLPLWNEYRARPVLAPLWPVAWITPVVASAITSLPQVLTAVEVFFLMSAAAAAIWPGLRFARVLASVALLQFMGIDNSYGQVTHYWHAWLLSSLILTLLPRGWDAAQISLAKQYQTLSVVWGAQAVVLLSYSMSGLWKVVFGLAQLFFGLANTFSPTALARHTIEQFMESGSMGVLGPWLVAHYWVGWPLFLAAMYLELFAVYAAFRPSLLPLWGLGLIGFHTMVYLTMAINFSYAALLLAVVIVSSPFRPVHINRGAVIAELPLFGWCWTRFRQAQSLKPVIAPAN